MIGTVPPAQLDLFNPPSPLLGLRVVRSDPCPKCRSCTVLEAEIRRYYDAGLDERVGEEADSFRNELDATRDEVLRDHAKQLAAIRKDYGEIVGSINAKLERIAKRYSTPFKRIIGRYNRLQAKIVKELEAEAPNPELVDWPEPDEGYEDPDPLFDSTRDYIEQIDRFKHHQGKPTTRKARNGGKP